MEHRSVSFSSPEPRNESGRGRFADEALMSQVSHLNVSDNGEEKECAEVCT